MPNYEGSLRRADLAADPVEQFANWYAQAERAAPLADATALASVDESGAPAVRFVLMKGFGAAGFDFYTDYRSAKAGQLEANPHASLAFWWPQLGRQVRIAGLVTRLDPSESDAYFSTRPRGAQLGAWASTQSAPIADRAELERRLEEAARRFEGREVERPDHWGGFRLSPRELEFWQQGEGRLHDRFRYRREAEGWTVERLSP
jgi:pyridoxamine 5'-phosphate oxidase